MNISFPHRHPDDCHCSLHLHRKKSPRQKEEGQRSHAGKDDGVFKSAFRHDSLLTASSGSWAMLPIFLTFGNLISGFISVVSNSLISLSYQQQQQVSTFLKG
jgi:hypothetical protein